MEREEKRRGSKEKEGQPIVWITKIEERKGTSMEGVAIET